MTKLERVLATFRGQPVDRVPLYDLLRCDDVIEFFAGEYAQYGEAGARTQAIAVDRMLDMSRGVGDAPVPPPTDFTDDPRLLEYARYASLTYRQHPIREYAGARRWVEEQVFALRRWRETTDLSRIAADHRAWFTKLRSWLSDDPCVCCLRQSGTGLDHVRGIVGIEFFSYLCADAPGLVSECLELVTQQEVAIIHAIADPALSPWALTYGDIAMKARLLHSPAWLRAEFFPLLARINAAYHEHGVYCLFHSDGYLMEVMDDIVAAGSDGINPLETVAGMDVGEVYRGWGEKLFLTGGIDMSQLLAHGTPEQVRQVCQDAIAAAPTKYLMGSTTEIDNSSRLENVLAMVEVAWGEPPRGAHPGILEQIARRKAGC